MKAIGVNRCEAFTTIALYWGIGITLGCVVLAALGVASAWAAGSSPLLGGLRLAGMFLTLPIFGFFSRLLLWATGEWTVEQEYRLLVSVLK